MTSVLRSTSRHRRLLIWHRGKARCGWASRGTVWPGEARQGISRGPARRGEARRGVARHGKARQGEARSASFGAPAAVLQYGNFNHKEGL